MPFPNLFDCQRDKFERLNTISFIWKKQQFFYARIAKLINCVGPFLCKNLNFIIIISLKFKLSSFFVCLFVVCFMIPLIIYLNKSYIICYIVFPCNIKKYEFKKMLFLREGNTLMAVSCHKQFYHILSIRFSILK